MKTPSNYILTAVASVLTAASLNAASVPGVDITVKKDGKAVSKAQTDANGAFSTGNLEPGNYNVEFRTKGSTVKGQQLSIAYSTGKGAARNADATGDHLAAGVAISVDVAKPGPLSGKIVSTGRAVAATNAPVPVGMEKVKANIKVINGKRHIWVPGPIGSHIAGRWVAEGADGAVLNTSNRKGGDREVIQKIQDQAGNVGQR